MSTKIYKPDCRRKKWRSKSLLFFFLAFFSIFFFFFGRGMINVFINYTFAVQFIGETNELWIA